MYGRGSKPQFWLGAMKHTEVYSFFEHAVYKQNLENTIELKSVIHT